MQFSCSETLVIPILLVTKDRRLFISIDYILFSLPNDQN